MIFGCGSFLDAKRSVQYKLFLLSCVKQRILIIHLALFAHLHEQALLHKFNTTGLWQRRCNLTKENICIKQQKEIR